MSERTKNHLTMLFAQHLSEHPDKIPVWVCEYGFALDKALTSGFDSPQHRGGYRAETLKIVGRRWRFDLAWPGLLVAVELDGGTWGRAVRCQNCGVTVLENTKDGRRVPVRAGTGHTSGHGFKNNTQAQRGRGYGMGRLPVCFR